MDHIESRYIWLDLLRRDSVLLSRQASRLFFRSISTCKLVALVASSDLARSYHTDGYE